MALVDILFGPRDDILNAKYFYRLLFCFKTKPILFSAAKKNGFELLYIFLILM